MSGTTTKILILLNVLVVAAVVFYNPMPEHEKPWAFVKQVLLESEFDGPEGHIIRWVKSPTISFVTDSPEDVHIFLSVINQINQALGQTNFSLKPVNSNGDIVFYQKTRDDVAPIFAKEDCGERMFFEDALGVGCIISNSKFHALKALTWGANVSNEAKRRSVMLEEIVQVLGPSNDSELFWDSLFYERKHGAADSKTLSPRDRKLLIFLYKHLKPGDDEAAVRRAFDAHWETITVK
jgi:hypothetical protein